MSAVVRVAVCELPQHLRTASAQFGVHISSPASRGVNLLEMLGNARLTPQRSECNPFAIRFLVLRVLQ